MTVPAFNEATGEVLFNDTEKLPAFCPKIKCCSQIPNTFPILLQFETGTSGGPVVIHCVTVTMIKVDATTWQGSFTAPNCLQGKNGKSSIDLEFTCDDQNAPDPEDCKQVFAWSIEGESITETNCCCFDSDPNLTGVSRGPFALVGGLGTLWTNARAGDGTGCSCATWQEVDAGDGSMPIAWAWDDTVDTYSGVCEEPSPCPDDCCPENPCQGMMAAMAKYQPPIPEHIEKWFA